MFKNGSKHCSNPATPGSDRCLFHQSDQLDWTQPYAQQLILDAAQNGTLQEACLAGAQLQNCDLSGINLKGADFSGADLSGANLSGSDCRNANFSGARLLGANLNKADCARARFDHADCQATSFDGAVLRKISCYRTDFRDTNLSRAVIAADALAEAKTNDKTIWPEVIPNGTGSDQETDHWTVAPKQPDGQLTAKLTGPKSQHIGDNLDSDNTSEQARRYTTEDRNPSGNTAPGAQGPARPRTSNGRRVSTP